MPAGIVNSIREDVVPQLLDTSEAATFLGLARTTLEHWRGLRKGPPFIRVGPRAVRYRRADLEEWLNEQVITTGN